MNDKIYPLAYKLASGQTHNLYYLAFPEEWKRTLLDIAQKSNPRFKDEYGLPTNTLKKMADSWMDGIIALAPLKKDSHDEHWLTSCHEYTEQEIKVLYNIIKAWVIVTYVTTSKVPPLVKNLARDFCDTIRPEDLGANQSQATVCLTLKDGTVCEESYQAIPLLVINRLLGQEIILNGQPLHLSSSGRNQLISRPISAPKNHHQYSFVFDFSVQTTPPKRQALLLCQLSIRRWIADSRSKGRVPFVTNSYNAHGTGQKSYNAHIRVSENKYCQVPITYNSQTRHFDWKDQDKEFYNIWGYEQLPSAEEVLITPTKFDSHILLPYKNGMRGFVDSKIGTGVSVVDKAALYQAITPFLTEMICEQPEAQRVNLRGQKLDVYRSPGEYDSPENFRKWVAKCVETDCITFELYGLWKDPDQQSLLADIQDKLSLDFGENTSGSCLEIRIVHKETGSLANAMDGDSRDIKIQRCDKIVQELGSTNDVIACIFVLPGRDNYVKGDPKQVLRNAFARTGRVVQFITPEEDAGKHKIENTVYDLYRQLGVIALPKPNQKHPALANTPCIGMHLCTQVEGIKKRVRNLPLYVTVDVLAGKTQVHCDVFSNRVVSYRKACLEMAQLFWKSDLEQRSVDAIRSPAKQKLIELKNRYYQRDDSVLFVVQSDGNMRAVWSGISDKEIGGYSVTDQYCPTQINVGMPKNPVSFSLENSGVRIIRIRSNQEVPDYFTDISVKSTDQHLQYSSVSGVFKYGEVFWGVHPRPNDPQYTKSFKVSKIDNSAQRFAEKDMIEVYPLQLQPGDDAAEWVFYTNALRHISIQYNQSTILPLPLHLGKALEEYLFDA